MSEEASSFSSRLDLGKLRSAVEEVKKEVAKTIVGQEIMVDLLLASILSDGHALIEGVPGVAKTLTAKLLASCVNTGFSRIQFTPDLMPSDVIGTMVFNQKDGDFNFRKGPVFSNIILIDEINRAPAKTQASLFEVMEERQITVDGTRYEMIEPFMVLATQNPIEQEGTYRLPEAQLDRFLFKIEVDYPTPEQEVRIIAESHARKRTDPVEKVTKVLSPEDIVAYRDAAASIHVEKPLFKYIADIVTATRDNHALFLGASPRASIAILRSSRAVAAMRGRDFVSPDDVKFVAPHVLKHRVVITPENEMEGGTPGAVVAQILDNIEVPR